MRGVGLRMPSQELLQQRQEKETVEGKEKAEKPGTVEGRGGEKGEEEKVKTDTDSPGTWISSPTVYSSTARAARARGGVRGRN